ncbi:Nif3-like dinuclear metal center hexameric protein [Jatrophihabitans sp.]|uniref:Nif3-like dinuclear metal center hexameric protein n=1 Tax=Jatrophihabitans sp. TaxID=1932789 RepID=UPI002B9B574B|nr:Nif3-like dinuclear metal center hexameric protein [Jatrophihabitans sp.]
MPSLADVLAALDGWYPPSTAESWDAVGLTCGDPAEPVRRVLLAVDCVPATVAEAVETGAQLLLTHHPLLLSGVHGVPATDPKGALVHRMIRAGMAHFVAHTNADVAAAGVSQALADCLGLRAVEPLDPDPAPALDHLTVYVPPADCERLIAALTEAGAGAVGNYDQATFTVAGHGSYRPLPGANPADGEIGALTRKPELALSVVLPRHRRAAVLAAMRSAHPYEEVAFVLTEQPRLAAGTGTGRIGTLAAPTRLAEFTAAVAARLPSTIWGVRAAGHPDQRVETVAVCGGSGASYAELARSRGADVYLTSDFKHHSALEAVTERTYPVGSPADLSAVPMALVDAAHWATEWPWLPVVADLLRDEFADLETTVSTKVTDPWTMHNWQTDYHTQPDPTFPPAPESRIDVP